MNITVSKYDLAGWLFSLFLFTCGVLNLALVHPVPGLAYLLITLLYLPTTNKWLLRKWGWQIPVLVKLSLGIILILFTFGVSDLGDMIDG